MKRFTLSPQAAEDIREASAYIARDNLDAAQRVRLRILESCRTIARNPSVGHSRTDLTDKPVLFWPSNPYVIIYNPARKPVEIVRIVRGARHIPSLL